MSAASTKPAAAPRDPDQTRIALLQAAAEEIHSHGFQAAGLNGILLRAGVTKGALYHHFANKLALGHAVLDEVLGPQLRRDWIEPLRDENADPLDVLIGMICRAGEEIDDRQLALGCPINNLAQEMSPVDDGFRVRINTLLDEWRQAIAGALARGQAAGMVRTDIEVQAAAAFLVAALEGSIGIAKNAQSRDLLMQCGQGVIDYLETLRAG